MSGGHLDYVSQAEEFISDLYGGFTRYDRIDRYTQRHIDRWSYRWSQPITSIKNWWYGAPKGTLRQGKIGPLALKLDTTPTNYNWDPNTDYSNGKIKPVKRRRKPRKLTGPKRKKGRKLQLKKSRKMRRRYVKRRKPRINYRRQIIRNASNINRLMSQKHSDVDQNGAVGPDDGPASIVTGHAAEYIHYITQGDAEGDRDGDEIRIDSIAFNLNAAANTNTVNPNSSTQRVVLVYDRTPSKTETSVATWSEIFQSDRISALMNISGQNKGRFQILYDNTFTFGTYSRKNYNVKKLIKRPLTCTFTASTGTSILDVAKGQLFFAFNNKNYSATNGVAVNWNINLRIRYRDM